MKARACALLAGSLALGGCVASAGDDFVPPGRGGSTTIGIGAPVAGTGVTAGSATHVALLVPLTGANAERGADLLKAAQLALAVPGAPSLDVKDTGGTAIGAANAARAAVAAGDTMILGPLTSAETAAVAPVALPSRVPVLAFTSDRGQAQPGVWVLGLTPAQQVTRLVRAAQDAGKPRIAALLPETDLGRAMGDALAGAAAKAGLPPPQQRSYGASMGSMDAAMRDLSDYADRRGKSEALKKTARHSTDPAVKQAAADAAKEPWAPLPFDALLLADTGPPLAELGTLIPYYDVDAKVLGPALWATPAARTGSGGVLEGSWYAAPDPSARGAFVQLFVGKFAVQPSVLADLAYDAASIARVTAPTGNGGSLVASLTRPGGFTGADGTLLLTPDGHVQRALAVFQLSHGTSAQVAPANLGTPSS